MNTRDLNSSKSSAHQMWRNAAIVAFLSITSGISVDLDDSASATPVSISSALASSPCSVGQVVDAARVEYGDGLLTKVVDARTHGPDAVGVSAKELRNGPGVASVGRSLPETPGPMLRGTDGNAGLVPPDVAERLLGREYRNFSDFRSDFWRATSETRYAQEFSPANRALMGNGKAPRVVSSQAVPEMGKAGNVYHIHHIEPIGQGGSVYDMSNMMIVTPRFHKEVLERSYHYGN